MRSPARLTIKPALSLPAVFQHLRQNGNQNADPRYFKYDRDFHSTPPSAGFHPPTKQNRKHCTRRKLPDCDTVFSLPGAVSFAFCIIRSNSLS